MFSNKWFQVFYDVDDFAGANSGDKAPGKIDTSDERKAFDSVDKDDEKAEDDKKEDKEKDEGTEDEEIEENLDDDDEEDKKDDDDDDDALEAEDEKDSIIQNLKAADKDIFKKVPELRGIIFREKQYAEIYPSIEEAKEAKDLAETSLGFQEDLERGELTPFMKSIKEMGPEALTAVAAGFLPALKEVDKELHFNLIGGEVKKILKAALQHATRQNDNNMKISAENIHWFLFGDTDIEREFGLKVPEKSEREKQLEERERKLLERDSSNFMNDIFSTTKSKLLKRIEKSFGESSGIPKWTLEKLKADIQAEIDSSLVSDPRFKASMAPLFKAAQKNGFRSEDKDKIISAYLSRASSLISPVRRSILKKAEIKFEEPKGEKKKEAIRIPGGNRESGNRVRIDPNRKIDYNKTSEEDLLSGKSPVYRS